ncbi:hypothetical protein ACQ4N7_28890 [Nodosilinea sp. AN01ver1]|uniref:hypothetical protein n=1 Tax=Nodosilinea sp. AN01ver1 TaxID=3423362 RepID=UPI003D3135C4
MTTQTQINPELLVEIRDLENEIKNAKATLATLILGANLAAGEIIVHSDLLD